jgi:hypothetical protein
MSTRYLLSSVPNAHCQALLVALGWADWKGFPIMQPQGSPRGCRRVEQIIRSDARRSICEVSFDLWEDWAQNSDPLCCSVLFLLVAFHWKALVERPETDLRVNLERPLLAV